jgi:two-component system cell cycle sensor histidine kinase/response regulator CckA
VILWNRACAALTVTPKEQVLGRPLDLSGILKDSTVPVLAELLLDLPEDEILKRHGQRGIRKYDPHPEAIETKGTIVVGGRTKRVQVIASKVRDPEGRLLGIIQCAQDITKEDRLQKQLLQAQKMESVGTLAGGMAHEFNNILAAIQGYTQLAIMECSAREPLASYLDVVEASCQRAANLVRNMLTFARADEGRKIPVKVNHLLESTQQLLRQTLPPDVAMELDLESGLPFVLSDPNQIEQAVINLAVNAKDAMPRGGVISLQSRLRDTPPACLTAENPARQVPYVEICVADAGEGIPSEIRGRIFDPFFTTKAPGKGTGLGLSIVYSIMENHHGCVLVDSEPGRGTQFHLYFPAMEEMPFIPTESTGPQRISPGRGEAILVVDDEDRLREMLAEILEAHGYRVDLAVNGREGLESYQEALAQGTAYDLVIVDLAMPVMSGQECLKELFALSPHAKVLVMSGLMEDVEKDEVLRKVRGFLRKPFLLSSLLTEVRKTLGTD